MTTPNCPLIRMESRDCIKVCTSNHHCGPKFYPCYYRTTMEEKQFHSFLNQAYALSCSCYKKINNTHICLLNIKLKSGGDWVSLVIGGHCIGGTSSGPWPKPTEFTSITHIVISRLAFAWHWAKAEYTLNKLPVLHRHYTDTERQTHTHTSTFTTMGNLELKYLWPLNLIPDAWLW